MIKVETFTMDDVLLTRTYSTSGYKIERDGFLYDEAIDPEWTHRTYTETDKPVESGPAYSFQEIEKRIQMNEDAIIELASIIGETE